MTSSLSITMRSSGIASLLAIAVALAAVHGVVGFCPSPESVALTAGVSAGCISASATIKQSEYASVSVQTTFASWYFQNQPCMLMTSGQQTCDKALSAYRAACISLGGHVHTMHMTAFRNNVPFTRMSYQCFAAACNQVEGNLIAARILNREANVQGITWLSTT